MNQENINQAVHIFGMPMSNFVRTVMLICEEKNIPYTFGFDIDGKEIEYKSEAHLNLHPYGKIPVLLHNGLALPETASICRYLDTQFNGVSVQPEEVSLAAYHDAFCAISSIYIDKAILRDCLLEFAFPKGENGEVRLDVVKNALPEVINTLKVITKELEKNRVINQEQFTIADALLAPMLHYLSALVPANINPLAEFPAVKAYIENLMRRPSCQKILVIQGK